MYKLVEINKSIINELDSSSEGRYTDIDFIDNKAKCNHVAFMSIVTKIGDNNSSNMILELKAKSIVETLNKVESGKLVDAKPYNDFIRKLIDSGVFENDPNLLNTAINLNIIKLKLNNEE